MLTDPKLKIQVLKAQQEKIQTERQKEEEKIKQEQEEDLREEKQKEEERKEKKKKLEEAKENLRQQEAQKEEQPKSPETTVSTQIEPLDAPKEETIKDFLTETIAETVQPEKIMEIIKESKHEIDDSESTGPSTSSTQEKLSEEELVDIAGKLSSLASSSYVEQEKEMIQKLKSKLEDKPSTQVEIAVGRIIEKITEQEEDEPTVKGLKTRLESMVSELESEVSKVELEVGDKYRLLDLDRDGTITVEELSGVVRILKDKYSEEEIQQIIESLDRDKDGKISVQGTIPDLI